ncbi:MAG TPA: uracil-DNA glycosylase [Oceanospirillaceae bacterium]|nr:uracil-DNA glycosylase [Oceanospirillaceae bacterium]
MSNIGNNPPNCMQCQHFYITWDEKFPRGCRLFNMKSRNLPMHDVLRIDGHPCRGFKQKVLKK